MRTDELQARLRALGLDPGPTDGIYGELTEEAVFDALDRWAPPVEVVASGGIVPYEWLPACTMQRIIFHWTAGAHKASQSSDVPHYHILIEDNGHLVRGSYSIKDNVDTSDGRYAAHTKNCNSGSIGVSVCCMAGAVESPFDAGEYPLLEKQWTTLAQVVAELCAFYGISVSRETVLSHAEVQDTLDIAQSGKWDIARLAFDPGVEGETACGDLLRDMASEALAVGAAVVPVGSAATSSPEVVAH